MGVPKFYRWISERYPCLSEVVKEYQVPEFDNLYLDMNGIIHNCSHPNDDDPHFRITEEQIFKDIFHYIEVLFRIIRPKKTFFMAVDGVAPRAKMNQQRGRRFRSAKEAEVNIKQALLKGETLPTEKRFDSNCITPGTKFMEKLQTQLEYFVKSKITSDQTWQGVDVYLSGHQTPGEGEHKITEFIRHERSQEGYNPNTRHCLYGLDADLMMLALCSHEPHFALLREEVKFTRRKGDNKTAKAEETTFHLLHISLMREYIEHEFEILKETLTFPFNLESIIDDWVLMGFLVGNDFIPHLPDLHISSDALPLLYRTYMEVLPTLDGYLNEGGIINLPRFQNYLKAVSAFDVEHFEEIYEDYKWLESKGKAKKNLEPFVSEPSVRDIRMVPKSEEKSIQIVKDLAIQQGTMSLSDNDSEEEDEEGEDQMFYREFKLHKKAYYTEKFKVTATNEQIQCIAFEYILGLQWICHYYYNGVQSWSWYYPYHYSPYLSDLTKVPDMKLKFKMNKPFLPYQQLLAVLPEASKDCIPDAYWNLMDENNSVIGDFYPTEFLTDLNGKKQEWEAVVLIPFIDETRLLEAMETCTAKLSKEERCRNQHGPCQLYAYDENAPHYVKSTLPTAFPDIPLCCATRTNIPANSWTKKNFNLFVKGLLPGCQLSVYYQGFPTLYHLPHKAYLKKQQVKVFQANSRNENMILKIVKRQEVESSSTMKHDKYGATMAPDESLEEIAQRLLGRSVYVNWPHMEEAKVVSVSDGITQFALREEVSGSRGSKHKLVRKEMSSSEIEMFAGDMHDIHQRCLNRRGIDLGETNVLIYAQLLLGRKYVCGKKGEITLEKQWSSTSQPFALQMTLKDISVQGPTFEKFTSLEELFPVGAVIFSLDFQHYGSIGKVVKPENGNTVVELEVMELPNLQEILRDEEQNSAYFPGYKAASMSRITPYLLSRITGSIFVFFPGQKRWSVGLGLKFTKDACGIAGYTKRKNNNWYYSSSLVEVVRQYQKKYPKVFQYLEKILSKGSEEQLNAEEIFPIETVEKLTELSAWLKSLPCFGGRKVHESSNVLEPSLITSVDEAVSSFKMNRSKPEQLVVSISPHSLYRPMAQQGTLVPDKNAKHQLLDRVVNVRMGFTVPLGYRGTIVGIHAKSNTEEEVMFDVMFDEEFLGGLTLGGQCPQRRGYKLPSCAIINLSYGDRTLHRRSSRPVAVVRPHHQQNLNNTNPRPLSSPAQSNNRSRFVQSPHSAFTPAKKSISQPTSGERPGHVTLLQRGSGASRAPLSANSQRKELPLKKKTGLDSKAPVKSTTTVKSSQSSPRHKASSTTKPGTTVKSAYDSTKGTPTTTSPFSLSQAAQSLPLVSKTQPAKSPSTSTKSSSSDVHTVSVTKFPTTAHTSSIPGQPQVHKLAIQTLLSRQSEHEKKRATKDDVAKSKDTKDPSAKNVGLSDAVKTTLKIPLSTPHVASATSADGAVDDQKQLNQLLATLQVSPKHPPPPLAQPHVNKQFSLQAFLASNPPPPMMWGYPPGYPLMQPQLMRPEHFQPPPPTFGVNAPPTGFTALSSIPPQPSVSSLQEKANSTFLKEGTDKLCEILSIGEDEKLKEDEKVLKANEEEVEKAEDGTSQSDNERKSDNDVSSEDDDRPPSVKESCTDGAGINSRMEELLKWCQSRNMFPPVYTYCDVEKGKEKFLASTVQLGNGLSFKSSSHSTRDKAMEEVAFLALQHLKEGIAQQVPVIPQSVPSLRGPSVHPSMMVSYPHYFVNDVTGRGQPYHYTQDGKVLPPPPYMLSSSPAGIPFSVPPPRIPLSGMHPAVINNFMSVAPGGKIIYPRPPVHSLPFHPPQPFYPVTAAPGVYTPPFVPRAHPTFDLPQSHYTLAPVGPPSSTSDSIKPVFVNNNPFIPSQVKYPIAVSQPFTQSPHIEPTGSANYVLSDNPPPPASSESSSTPSSGVVKSSASKPKKPKAKLAISFASPTK